jgi:hypothetical protein
VPNQGTRSHASIGFTVKSGWAAAVLVAGPIASPHVLDSRRIELSDPEVAESRQPYHAGFATARGPGPELTRLLASVKRFGRKSVTEVIRQHRDSGHALHSVGIVVGSLIDPDLITNAHIRIHALEGRLFRTVVEDAIVRNGLHVSIWRERDIQAEAVKVLRRTKNGLRAELTQFGRAVDGPWRAEHRAAALSAWLVLAA